MVRRAAPLPLYFFFFNDTATTEIYTLSLHDALPILNVAEPAPLSMAVFLRAMVARLGVRCVFLPLPFAPVLAALRAAEALGVPLPLRSESVLAIRGLRQAPVAEDLRRLDLSVRSAEESLADVL